MSDQLDSNLRKVDIDLARRIDRTVKLWDASSGAEVLTLKSQLTGPYSASFSPDGSRILTSSYNGTPKVWDAAPNNHAQVMTNY